MSAAGKPPKAARTTERRTAYDDFLGILSKFRGLSAGALGAGAAVPFFAFVAGIAPPWPDGVMLITGLVELVSLIMAFQFLRPAPRRVVNRTLGVASALLLLISTAYLTLFAMLTYQTPTTGQRWVKGFVCQPEIGQMYASECPFLGVSRLRDAQYNAEVLWTDWSVALSQVAIATVWCCAFFLLSIVIGAFLVYQTKRPSVQRL